MRPTREGNAMKLKIDFRKCIRAGECYYNHPDLFDESEDGSPVIQVEELSTEQARIEARQAAEVCPAGAIFPGETEPGLSDA
jgi:ferredoxin